MEFKDFLKELKFNSKEIEKITNAETPDKDVQDIVQDWDVRNVKDVIERPDIEKSFRENIAPKAKAEGRINERKLINKTYSLGLSNSKMSEMTEEEWEVHLKSSLTKSDNDEVKQWKEKFDTVAKEKLDLEDEHEKTKSEIEKTWKQKYAEKVLKAKKATHLSSLTDTVIKKESIDDIIDTKFLKNGITYELDENDNVVLFDKNGKLMKDARTAYEIDAFLTDITSEYAIKTPLPPTTTVTTTKTVDDQIERSENALRYEAKLMAKKEPA